MSDPRIYSIAYCTNVHPSETLDELRAVVSVQAPAVRRALGAEHLPVGLYLSQASVQTLARDPGALDELRGHLRAGGLVCRTFNGFPYGGFHAPVVKEAVYRPDWRDERRVAYTLALAEVMSAMLDDGETGTISTVAGGFRPKLSSPEELELMARNLARVGQALARIEATQGRRIVLCLEQEPFTTLQTTAQTVDFFTRRLWPLAATATPTEDTLRRHIGVCFDCCHQAVVFEDAANAMRSLAAAGVVVGKVQLSNAVETRGREGLSRLASFVEPRYLHQTFVRDACGAISSHLDLPGALDALENTPGAWTARTHFHVPLFYDEAGPFGSTQVELEQAIGALAAATPGEGGLPHLEVETYTWPVLPNARDSEWTVTGLTNGIADEIRWAAQAFRR